MKVLLTIPGVGRHGGVRVILEWANRLTKWHDVTLLSLVRQKPDWFKVNPKVKWIYHPQAARGMDIAIITSPHTIHWIETIKAKKKFLFCQMAEHLFRPDQHKWLERCHAFYTSQYPMISISQWNIALFKNEFGRTGETHYVGNGVNLDDFPISTKPKDGKTILVEGWVSHNQAKDVDYIGPKVALRLKQEYGYHIIAYSQLPNTTGYLPDEYYCKPDLKTMNELYERATIMIKASRYDARSCAPLEAMTKGTVTVRAVIQGDDDLTDSFPNGNCFRCGYDENELYELSIAAMRYSRLDQMADNCRKYVQTYTWDYWMERINNILTA